MCTPCSSTLHLCTYCGFQELRKRRAFAGFSLLVVTGLMSTTNSYKVTECVLRCNASIYNFQQRISWLSHRWRTQRNAISNVNCRIQWIIESLNAPCAPWYSGEHACLSVMVFSTFITFLLSKAWTWRLVLAYLLKSAPLKCISVSVTDRFGVIIICAVVVK